MTYGYMIDNIVLVLTGALLLWVGCTHMTKRIVGTLHDRDWRELVVKCHPLGTFEELGTVAAASSAADLFRMVSLLSCYFFRCLAETFQGHFGHAFSVTRRWHLP